MLHITITRLLVIFVLCQQICVMRAMEDVGLEDGGEELQDYDVQLVDVPVESLKRSALGRRVRGDPFAFGLGKRSEPFAFGLGRRKRFYWKYNPFNLLKEEGAKRDPYAFGLGK